MAREIVHVIPRTFSHEALTKLSVVGLPRVPSIAASFAEAKPVMGDTFTFNIPRCQFRSDKLATPFWDTPSFVVSSETAVAEFSSIFPKISGLLSQGRGFQRSVYRSLEIGSFVSLDWLLFVKRRLQLTFPYLKRPLVRFGWSPSTLPPPPPLAPRPLLLIPC